MNIHLPQTNEARSEAMVLMGVKSNTLTSRSGEPLVASIQDFITSMYLLTQKDVVFTHSEMSRLISAVTANHPERITIPPPAILKPARLWTGKQLFSMLLRPNNRSKELVNLSAKVSRRYFSDSFIKERLLLIVLNVFYLLKIDSVYFLVHESV